MKKTISILLTLCLLISAFSFGSAAIDAELVALQSEHPYSNNTYQTWTHTEKGAINITLTFSTNTAVEDGNDFIYILDENNQEVGCYTGTELAGKAVTVFGEKAKIRLESNDTETAYGFAVTKVESIANEDSAPLNLLKHIDGLEVGLSDAAADISGDGNVSVYDAVKLLQLLGEEQGETSAAQYDEENYIKLMDYNIRYANDGDNKNIADRAPRLETIVNKYQPDLIGLQEVTPTWVTYLEEYFVADGTYEMTYKYRKESNPTSLEATPILWNPEKFELLDEGYFWLSGTPDVESNTWNGPHYRICNWVKLKVIKTGKEFLFFNTHLEGSLAVPSAELILERATNMGGFTQYPVLLTGDFNIAPFSDGYNLYDTKFDDFNAALGFDWTPSNNGYNIVDDTDPAASIKDFAMFSPDFLTPYEYRILNENILNGYISDHRGVYVEFALV